MSEKITTKTLIRDLSNEAYHGENEHFSSSQIKDALDDIEYFYKLHITKEVTKEKAGAYFDVGTYIHTAILEPHLLETECAIYPGKTRRGKEYDAFVATHPGMTVITQDQADEAQACINAVKADQVSMMYLEPTEKEVSLFYSLLDIPVKVRADAICHGAKGINGDRPYILDLKSCSCNAKSTNEIANTIESYNYDLSAALYLDVFSAIGGKKYEDYFWVFTSKKFQNAQTWKATPEMLATGRAKLRLALSEIKKYRDLGWKFPSELKIISPKKFISDQWLSSPPPIPAGESSKKATKQKTTKSADADVDLL